MSSKYFIKCIVNLQIFKHLNDVNMGQLNYSVERESSVTA
jgi:hypothetical protein